MRPWMGRISRPVNQRRCGFVWRGGAGGLMCGALRRLNPLSVCFRPTALRGTLQPKLLNGGVPWQVEFNPAP